MLNFEQKQNSDLRRNKLKETKIKIKFKAESFIACLI